MLESVNGQQIAKFTATKESTTNALDDCSDPSCSLGLGPHHGLHSIRIDTYPSGTGARRDLDSGDSGPAGTIRIAGKTAEYS